MDIHRVGPGVAVALACLAIGCGGDDGDGGSKGSDGGASSGDEAQMRATLRAWGDAVADNDPEEACSHLTKSAQEKAAGTFPGARTCVDAHRRALAAVGEEGRRKLREQLAGVDFTVKVSGETAVLRAADKPGSPPLRMRRERGEWKIDQSTVFYNPD